MNTNQRTALEHFKRCAQEAPQGCYEEAKALNAVINDAMDNLAQQLRGLGLKANNCDLAFELEAAIYAFVKESNPEATVFPTAEGFGKGLDGPARERIMFQAQQDRDFLRSQLNSRPRVQVIDPPPFKRGERRPKVSASEFVAVNPFQQGDPEVFAERILTLLPSASSSDSTGKGQGNG